MNRKQLLLSLILFASVFSAFAEIPDAGPLRVSRFHFYSQSLRLHYDATVTELGEMPSKTQDLLTIYGYLERTQYDYSLRQLLHMKEQMGLNDWLYYELLVEASRNIFPEEAAHNRIYYQWFMLRKSGYDAQIYFLGEEVHLHALTDEEDFGFYTIIRQGKRYINISAKRDQQELTENRVLIPKLPDDGATQPFSMRINELPEFDDSPEVFRMLEFEHDGQKHVIPVKINQDHIRIMDEYPFSDQALYFNIGLSQSARTSLLPVLENLTEGLSTKEKLTFILSFTRTAFLYKEDKLSYGQEKPMTAEQTLYYHFSDCEDRSALFFLLVKELMNVPVIAVDFETHVGVAVEIAHEGGNYFNYNGRRYIYCEPTGPQNSLAIGEMWEDIRTQKATILVEYIPE